MVEPLALLIRANLAAAAAILIIIALRRPARALFGARIAYGLWSLPALATAAAFLPARVMRLPAPALVTTPQLIAPENVSVLDAPRPAIAPLSVAFDIPSLLLIVWAAGVIAALCILARTQRRFTDEALSGQVGPAVVGVLIPRILRPHDFAQRFTPAERRLVLAHERAHITRQDSRINGLAVLTQCLFWFNPLIHLGAHALRIDQELACDETVIARFPRARALYAGALMKAQLTTRPLPLGCYWPSGTRHPLLERVDMIKRDDFTRSRRLAGGVALAGLCAATGLAAWAAQPPVVKIAQAQVAAPSAVGAALGAPAKAKTAAAPAAATVKAGEGGAVANTPLNEAISSGDVRRAIELGATASQVAEMIALKNPNMRLPPPESAAFVRGQGGLLNLGYGGPAALGARMANASVEIASAIPPGGLEDLPTFGQMFPTPPPPPPTPDQLVLAQRVVTGLSAQEAAGVILAVSPPSALTPALDLSTSTYVRGPDGGLMISIGATTGGVGTVRRVPGAENYPGLANLPPAVPAAPVVNPADSPRPSSPQ